MQKVLICKMVIVFALAGATVAQEKVTVTTYCKGFLCTRSAVPPVGPLILATGSRSLRTRRQLQVMADVHPSIADNRYCSPQNLPKFGGSDGPASMPKTCFNTARASTPSPGKVWSVPNGAVLSTVLSSVKCGDA